MQASGVAWLDDVHSGIHRTSALGCYTKLETSWHGPAAGHDSSVQRITRNKRTIRGLLHHLAWQPCKWQCVHLVLLQARWTAGKLYKAQPRTRFHTHLRASSQLSSLPHYISTPIQPSAALTTRIHVQLQDVFNCDRDGSTAFHQGTQPRLEPQ